MKITEAIKEVGRPVQFYPSLAKVFGIEEAIFIGQLLYWKGKETDKKGIRKSIGEIESETALSVKQQKRIKKKLQEQGCLRYEYDRTNHKAYYQIFENKIDEIYQGYSPKGLIPKGTKVSSQRDEGIVPKGLSSIHRVHIDYTNSKTSFANKDSTLISEIIKLFETINPACKKMYGNKTQRGACEFLLKEFTFSRVKKMIETVLPKSNGMEYFPTITTPCHLRDKWASLETAIRRHTSKEKAEQTKKGNVYF